MLHEPYHIQIITQHLSKNLENLCKPMRDEVAATLADHIGDSEKGSFEVRE